MTAAGILDVLADRARWCVHTAEAAAGLALLPDASVHCVVTSPPYWRQRDYGESEQLGLAYAAMSAQRIVGDQPLLRAPAPPTTPSALSLFQEEP